MFTLMCTLGLCTLGLCTLGLGGDDVPVSIFLLSSSKIPCLIQLQFDRFTKYHYYPVFSTKRCYGAFSGTLRLRLRNLN